MKTSEDKLHPNLTAAMLAVFQGIGVIHEHGGYGTIELKVKDDLVVSVKPTVEWHMPKPSQLLNGKPKVDKK